MAPPPSLNARFRSEDAQCAARSRSARRERCIILLLIERVALARIQSAILVFVASAGAIDEQKAACRRNFCKPKRRLRFSGAKVNKRRVCRVVKKRMRLQMVCKTSPTFGRSVSSTRTDYRADLRALTLLFCAELVAHMLIARQNLLLIETAACRQSANIGGNFRVRSVNEREDGVELLGARPLARRGCCAAHVFDRRSIHIFDDPSRRRQSRIAALQMRGEIDARHRVLWIERTRHARLNAPAISTITRSAKHTASSRSCAGQNFRPERGRKRQFLFLFGTTNAQKTWSIFASVILLRNERVLEVKV